MKFVHTTALAFSLAALSACAGASDIAADETATQAASAPVVVDIRMRDDAESAYRSVDAVIIPASHEIGDGMFPYEGVGWENGQVGYRLYLDGRLTSDIFGKQVSEPVLDGIDEYGSYHDLADWGMDVLKVGPSLGIGGIGIMRDGAPAQFGSVPELSAMIDASGGDEGRFTITTGGIEGADGATGGYAAVYSIGADSPMTMVSVTPEGSLPYASGIVMHDGAQFWQSEDSDANGWRYVATWGAQQSENADGLGMALFYRADQASYGGLANETHYVTFADGAFEYGFLAAWELDPAGISDREAFAALLESELARLEGTSE